MTHEEKAREIGEFFDTTYPAALEMAEWKDQQFKEYLEKRKDEYMLQRDNANMCSEQWAVFNALTCSMHQIINEPFKED